MDTTKTRGEIVVLGVFAALAVVACGSVASTRHDAAAEDAREDARDDGSTDGGDRDAATTGSGGNGVEAGAEAGAETGGLGAGGNQVGTGGAGIGGAPAPDAGVPDAGVGSGRCGDGIIQTGETCDDQGTAGGDGCSATCAVETGWSCITSPSVCVPICGDNLTVGGEACDDGNSSGGDGCSFYCQLETLFFSEYVEGSSNNKALEITNPSKQTADLTGCSVVVYSNGATSPSATIALGGSLGGGYAFVVCSSLASSAVTSACDLPSGSLNFNGDDAIALVCGGTTLDVIGQIGYRPAQGWGTPPTSTVGATLRRHCDVSDGDTNGTDAFDPAVEWAGFPIDTFDNLDLPGCSH